MAATITMIQPWKNGINHWVLHLRPIVLKGLGLVGGFPTLQCTCMLAAICHFPILKTSYVIGRASYWKNPGKSRASSRVSYWEEPESKRASSRASCYTRYWSSEQSTNMLFMQLQGFVAQFFSCYQSDSFDHAFWQSLCCSHGLFLKASISPSMSQQCIPVVVANACNREVCDKGEPSGNLGSKVWPALNAFIVEHNPDTNQQVLYMCNYCKPLINFQHAVYSMAYKQFQSHLSWQDWVV